MFSGLTETGRRVAVYARIGWRNLWRNRRRTAVILTAIVLGVWSMLLLGALMRGLARRWCKTASGPSPVTCRSMPRATGATRWRPTPSPTRTR